MPMRHHRSPGPSRTRRLAAVAVLALCATQAGATGPTLTIAEGKSTIFSGGAAYLPAAGARLRTCDIVRTGPQALVQIEYEDGTKIVLGPESRLVFDLPLGGDPVVGPHFLISGWAKLTVPKRDKAPPYRINTPHVDVLTDSGIVALRAGDGDVFVAEPAQHPPQARGHGAVAGVVAHHLIRGHEAAFLHPRCEIIGIGQRVAPVAPGPGSGKIALEVREQRPRNVRFAVLLLPERGVGEIVPAVEDAPLRVCAELGRGHEGSRHQINGVRSTFPGPVANLHCRKENVDLTPFICRACGAATRGSGPRRLPSATGRVRRRRVPARTARGARGPAARRSRCPRSRFRRTPPVAPR